MKIMGTELSPLGMGCWPIGGTMYNGAQSLGYTGADDDVAIQTIHAALDGGISLFDTAAAYGAGHSERLLARALKNRPDALVATKIGIGVNETTRQISFDRFTPDQVAPAVDASLARLNRDRIDLVLLHVNEMPVSEARDIFDALDRLCDAGKLRAYGWSTDFSDSAAAFASRQRFQAVEFAMNVFFDAPRMQDVARREELCALVRSPLAMGVLSGKYDTTTVMPTDDVRASREVWMEYFKNGRVNPAFMETLGNIRELLTTDGRSLVQGALGWIWGQSPTHIPIPGAKTVDQIKGIAGALSFGPLPAPVMEEIERLIPRSNQAPDRPR